MTIQQSPSNGGRMSDARIKNITKAEVPKFGQTPKSKTMKQKKRESEVATNAIQEVTSGQTIQRLMQTGTIERNTKTTGQTASVKKSTKT